MDIRALELLERGIVALESIAKSLDSGKPAAATPEIVESRHALLAAECRIQIKRIGYHENDYAAAKALLNAMFSGKTSLKELTIAQLTEYAKQLRQLEINQLET